MGDDVSLLIEESGAMTEVPLLGTWSCPGQWGNRVRCPAAFLVWREASWEERRGRSWAENVTFSPGGPLAPEGVGRSREGQIYSGISLSEKLFCFLFYFF